MNVDIAGIPAWNGRSRPAERATKNSERWQKSLLWLCSGI